VSRHGAVVRLWRAPVVAVGLGAAAAWAGVACGTSRATGPGDGSGRISRVVVSPESSATVAGTHTTLVATARTASGATLAGVAFFWSSSDTTIATVDKNGTASARRPGTAEIAASAQGVSGVATLAVLPPPVGAVIVSPSVVTLRVNTTMRLVDTVRDAAGQLASNANATWATDNPAVATVDGDGLVVARGLGTAHITATVGARSGQALVTVTPVPVARIAIAPRAPSIVVHQTTRLTAMLVDSAGDPLGGAVAWQSLAPATATVSSAGLVTGVAPGLAVVTAAAGGQSAADTITVSEPPASAVVLSPAASALLVGQTEQLSARVTDATGAPIPGASVTFSSGSPAVAAVDAHSGVVTAVGVGTAAITGTSGGKTGQAIVTVSLVPVASVLVTPPVDTLLVGRQAALRATALDSAGHQLTGRPVTWASSNSTVAAVDASGQVTARAAGTAVVVATVGGVGGASTITVPPVPVGRVTIAPKSASVPQGGQQQFTATVRDQNGVVVSDRPVTWSSSATGVAVVSGSGLATAVGVGSASIVAQSGGAADTAILTVTQVPVASVTVTPNPASVTVQGTVALTATTRDAQGTVLTGRTVTWSSANPQIATVNGSGVVTGTGVGSVTVTATSEGRQGSATVNVSPVAVSSVTIAPSAASVRVGGSVTLTATARDANGNPISGATVTWSSRTPAVATVDPVTGVVLGVATGVDTIVATAGTATGKAVVQVSATPIASIALAPADTTVTVGQSAQLRATVIDSLGHTVLAPTIAWSSTPAGRVSASGLVTPQPGDTAGPITVSASSGGKSASATVHVAPAPVASVAVLPADTTITVAQTAQLRAVLRDGQGNVTAGAVRWSSAPGGRVSRAGVVTPHPNDAGTAIVVTATAGDGVSGSATVTVTAVPVSSVTVTPNPAAVRIGGTVALTATARDANGNPVPGVAIAWSSETPGVATVDPGGIVTGVANGTATVLASTGGITGAAVVQVSPAPVASIAIVPGDTTITTAQTAQLSATVTDSLGNPVAAPSVTWSSAPPGRVASSGVVAPQPADTAAPIIVTASSGGKSATATVVVVSGTGGDVAALGGRRPIPRARAQ